MRKKIDMQSYCSSWYKSLSGQSSLDTLDDLCTDILSETFGYYAIEVGLLSGSHDLLQFSRIAAGFSITNNECQRFKSASVISKAEHLPIATDNVDLVVASHVLELSQDPHQVLREIDRVLVPEGHCLLIGFNPFGISQLKRNLTSRISRKKNPQKMRSVPRVRDWFSLLGFEVLDVHYLGVRPPVKNKKVFDALNWLEKFGEFAGLMLANMYVIHVKKQIVAMRPHKKVWRAPAVLSGGKVVLNSTAQKIRRENYSNL